MPEISISFHWDNPAREQFAVDAVYALRLHAFEQRFHRLIGGELYHSNLTDKLE